LTADELLDAIAAAPHQAGLFLDFDGTLAPIVEDPTTSALPDGAADVLARLASRLGFVAIVSGRPVSFLAERAAVAGVRLLGLYGIEQWRDGQTVTRPEAAAFEPALDTARERITLALAGHEGVLFEDKGLGLALHWRNAPDRRAAQQFVEGLSASIAAETGLMVEPGKFVAELRPALAWDKGASVRALVAEFDLPVVVYVGDDKGDLAAFAAVTEAGGYAVAVDHGDETPAQVRAAANVLLAGTDDVHRFLARLADRLA
jgi:trehalose 6-phosphate phosphatase